MIEVAIMFMLLGLTTAWAQHRSWITDWWAWRKRRPLVGDPMFKEKLFQWRLRRPNRKVRF